MTVAVVALVLALASLAALVAYVSLRELEAEINELRQDLAARGRDEEISELRQTLYDFERREARLVEQLAGAVGVRIDLEVPR